MELVEASEFGGNIFSGLINNKMFIFYLFIFFEKFILCELAAFVSAKKPIVRLPGIIWSWIDVNV